jgi:hypothetical protein
LWQIGNLAIEISNLKPENGLMYVGSSSALSTKTFLASSRLNVFYSRKCSGTVQTSHKIIRYPLLWYLWTLSIAHSHLLQLPTFWVSFGGLLRINCTLRLPRLDWRSYSTVHYEGYLPGCQCLNHWITVLRTQPYPHKLFVIFCAFLFVVISQIYIEFDVDKFFHFDVSDGAVSRGAHSRYLYR